MIVIRLGCQMLFRHLLNETCCQSPEQKKERGNKSFGSSAFDGSPLAQEANGLMEMLTILGNFQSYLSSPRVQRDEERGRRQSR